MGFASEASSKNRSLSRSPPPTTQLNLPFFRPVRLRLYPRVQRSNKDTRKQSAVNSLVGYVVDLKRKVRKVHRHIMQV